jgi:hypothetical protein
MGGMAADQLTVAFWNRWKSGNREDQAAFLVENKERFDVLLLAEMTGIAFRDFRGQLGRTSGLCSVEALEHPQHKGRPNGVVALARPGLRLRHRSRPLEGLPTSVRSGLWRFSLRAGYSRSRSWPGTLRTRRAAQAMSDERTVNGRPRHTGW